MRRGRIMDGELIQLDYRIRLDLESKGMPNRKCWFDGEECPYGRPNGEFRFRPKTFCQMPFSDGAGCSKLADERELIEDFFHQFIENYNYDEREPINVHDLESAVAEQSLTLSDKIRQVTQEANEIIDLEKKSLLNEAAEIIEKAEESNPRGSICLNPEIVNSSVIDMFF